ncbi:VSAA-LIKE (Mycoplasma pulmonis) PROTEIN [Mycoplasmopsis pulmonis]|uniref:VSAA-LIKE (Mycoplasma pulmonis) PROTEIN n=2 Tax=Mycoplasmopsis pulmonis TaxID=2107 RepID=Q98QQ3_MYCPU|nr:lipoprotein 17-related variable surface protein [Mycoplasmopsis pulmonis]CAC13481.1 VSAA-LIKE (Mycoplasma pulmonis) PROTEIN [Mycoplasmopsis pulmonis]
MKKKTKLFILSVPIVATAVAATSIVVSLVHKNKVRDENIRKQLNELAIDQKFSILLKNDLENKTLSDLINEYKALGDKEISFNSFMLSKVILRPELEEGVEVEYFLKDDDQGAFFILKKANLISQEYKLEEASFEHLYKEIQDSLNSISSIAVKDQALFLRNKLPSEVLNGELNLDNIDVFTTAGDKYQNEKFDITFEIVEQENKAHLNDFEAKLNVKVSLSYRNSNPSVKRSKILNLSNLKNIDTRVQDYVNSISTINLKDGKNQIKNKLASEITNEDLKISNFVFLKNDQAIFNEKDYSLEIEKANVANSHSDTEGSIYVNVKLTKGKITKISKNPIQISGFKKITTLLEEKANSITKIELTENNIISKFLPSEITNEDLNQNDNLKAFIEENKEYDTSKYPIHFSIPFEEQYYNNETGTLKVVVTVSSDNITIKRSELIEISGLKTSSEKIRENLLNLSKILFNQANRDLAKKLPSEITNDDLKIDKLNVLNDNDLNYKKAQFLSFEIAKDEEDYLDDLEGFLKVKLTYTEGSLKDEKVLVLKDLSKIIDRVEVDWVDATIKKEETKASSIVQENLTHEDDENVNKNLNITFGQTTKELTEKYNVSVLLKDENDIQGELVLNVQLTNKNNPNKTSSTQKIISGFKSFQMLNSSLTPVSFDYKINDVVKNIFTLQTKDYSSIELKKYIKYAQQKGDKVIDDLANKIYSFLGENLTNKISYYNKFKLVGNDYDYEKFGIPWNGIFESINFKKLGFFKDKDDLLETIKNEIKTFILFEPKEMSNKTSVYSPTRLLNEFNSKITTQGKIDLLKQFFDFELPNGYQFKDELLTLDLVNFANYNEPSEISDLNLSFKLKSQEGKEIFKTYTLKFFNFLVDKQEKLTDQNVDLILLEKISGKEISWKNDLKSNLKYISFSKDQISQKNNHTFYKISESNWSMRHDNLILNLIIKDHALWVGIELEFSIENSMIKTKIISRKFTYSNLNKTEEEIKWSDLDQTSENLKFNIDGFLFKRSQIN